MQNVKLSQFYWANRYSRRWIFVFPCCPLAISNSVLRSIDMCCIFWPHCWQKILKVHKLLFDLGTIRMQSDDNFHARACGVRPFLIYEPDRLQEHSPPWARQDLRRSKKQHTRRVNEVWRQQFSTWHKHVGSKSVFCHVIHLSHCCASSWSLWYPTS